MNWETMGYSLIKKKIRSRPFYCNMLSNMLYKKLEYYGIRGITKNCFHPYLIVRMKYTTLYHGQSTISSKRYEKKVHFTRPFPLEEQCC